MKMASMNCSGCKPLQAKNQTQTPQAHANANANMKQANKNLNCAGCGPKGQKLNKIA